MNRRFERRVLRGGGGVVPPSNPLGPIAALAHTVLLYGPDYSGGTWTGTASAGTSGGRNGTTAGLDPTVGAALNGHSTVAFDGTQRLAFSYALSTVFSASDWSFWCLCKQVDNAAAQVLFSDQIDGYAIMGMSATPKWEPKIFSGGYNADFGPASSFATWQLLQAKQTGGNLLARINSGGWSSVARGNIGSLVQNCRIGATYNATLNYDGLVAGMGCSDVAFSDASFDAIKAGLNAWGGLAL